jgi:hypothetical protein
MIESGDSDYMGIKHFEGLIQQLFHKNLNEQ